MSSLGLPVEAWVIIGLGVLALMLLMSMLARLYRKAGPHEALIVYGFRGTRVVQGHGTIIFPMIENCRDRIARFKLPRYIRFVSDWPMSATKIQKGPLREQLLAELSQAAD